MTPYLWRLCCLSLASAFIVQLCAGLLIRVFAEKFSIWAQRFDPSRAAILIFTLRWMPALLGLFVAVCICVPSYLRLEPAATEEEIGFACWCLASTAVLSYLIPIARTAFALIHSEFRVRSLLRDAEERQPGIAIIPGTVPAMALVGLFRSRVLVSREVTRLLSEDQMDAALRHELAHAKSGDNSKRLLFEAAPIDGSGWRLRASWARFTEWAADDRATEGDSARSVALASALVSVARLAVPPLPNASLLVSECSDLRSRVERLLQTEKIPATHRFPFKATLAISVAAAIGIIVIAQQPSATALVHQILESLVD